MDSDSLRIKFTTISIVLVFIISMLVAVDMSFNTIQNVSGTKYVGGSGADNYSTIQEGINAANPGETVFVYSGTYYENVVVDKTINLTGEDSDSTIIDGSGSGNVVRITAHWVNITFFKIINGSHGLFFDSSNGNIITDNNISANNQHGVYLYFSQKSNLTSNTLMENSIFIFGTSLEHWDTHNIDSSNTVNGKPVYYRKNQTGGSIPAGSGEVILANCTNVNIINQDLINGSVGIELGFSSNNNLTKNTVSNNIYGIYNYQSDGTKITDIDASNNQVGINLHSSKWDNITGNNLSNNQYGIYLASSSDNNIISNNVSLNSKYGIYLTNSGKNNISTNIISSNFENGIALFSSSNNNLISNNKITNNNKAFIPAGIRLKDSSNNIINGNNVSYNGNGIRLDGLSKNNLVKDNIISHQGSGIRIEGSNNEIKNNNIFNNQYGFYMMSQYDKIISNDIESNNYGIYILASYPGSFSQHKIISNNISKNGYGVRITAGSNNIINSNNIFSNYNHGIVLSQSSNNEVLFNNISNNTYGLTLQKSSTNNRIYHNNIIENTIQALDDTNKGNYWDNGYPSGGNYWSDYTGIDDFKGPDQDIPGSDGIGDTNYSIDTDSQDNYPLMAPIGDFIFLYEGWNLISIPFILLGTNLGVILNSIKGSYDAVQWYNISDNSDPWKHNSTKKLSHLNDLDRIDHTMGFWIHITEQGGILFQYPGTEPIENQTINIYPGWNLIGYPSLTSHNRTEGLNNLTFGSDVDMIWTYNAATQKWKELGPSNIFELGRGYWVHSKVTKTWIVPL